MKPGDLVRVNEWLKGGDGCILAIYLGEISASRYHGKLARILLTNGKILEVHHAHLRKL